MRGCAWSCRSASIVAVAIICFIVAVLTSARRADEVSFKREQQLIRAGDRGPRRARVARGRERRRDRTAPSKRSATSYDPQWADQLASATGCETYFDHDLVVIVDGSDQVEYARSRSSAEVGAIPLPPALFAILDFVRGRLEAVPAGARPVIAFAGCGASPAVPPADRAVHEQTGHRRRGRGRLRQRSCRRQCRRADRHLRQIYRRRIAAEDRRRAATFRAAFGRRSGAKRRDASCDRHRRPARQPDRPLGLEAEQARRPGRGKRAAVHRGGARRFRAARRLDDAPHAADRRRRSPPAKRNCAISRCTIRSAGCPTASISASGSRR